MQPINIGITLQANSSAIDELISANGYTQNVIFLYHLLQKIGHNVFFVYANSGPLNLVHIAKTPYKAYSIKQIIDNKAAPLDLLLEGSVVHTKELRDRCRTLLGTKIVALNYGHEMIHDMERLFYPIKADIQIRQGEPDAIWASPHFENSYSYLETLLNAPVFTCPYIWEPQFIDKPFKKIDYRETRNIQVMESNISLMKNALIPLTIAEKLCRDNPDTFSQMNVNVTENLIKNTYFLNNIVPNMPWLKGGSGKVVFSPRKKFTETFKYRDILLSHQWGCELNYIYLEALYKNIPLVHNSPRLKSIGYYYDGFDVADGCKAVKKAINDRSVSAYHKKGLQFIKQFSINKKSNQKGYQNLIEKTLAL